MEKKFLGIEIGGTKIQLFLSNEKGDTLSKFRTVVGEQKKAHEIRKSIKRIIESEILPLNENIQAAGIGFGGPVDMINGTIHSSFQVKGWEGFKLANWISQIINAPAFIENDANLAALAEAIKGAGKNFNKVFYITIGSGIGGGFIINKTIYHGHHTGEVEVGHLQLTNDGPTFESECSGWAIDRKIREAIKLHPESKLAQIIGTEKNSEAKYLMKAFDLKCTIAKQIFTELTTTIAFGLSHVIHILNPDIIIIGGGISLMGEPLVSAIQDKISKYLMLSMLPGPKVCTAALHEDVVAIGALLLAINNQRSNI